MTTIGAAVGLLLVGATAASLPSPPKVGIVNNPCAELAEDSPSQAYKEWVVSTDPAASPPARSVSELAQWEAARDARMRYDWANVCRYRAANSALGADSARVVFIGNSITEYWGTADPGMFERHIINRGIAGQVTAQTLARFMADVVVLRPSVVHIWTGTNDIAGNAGPTTFEDIEHNIRAMIAIARANKIAVVIGSVTPAHDFAWRRGLQPATKIVELNSRLKKLAEEQRIGFADYYQLLNDGTGGMQTRYSRDGVHLNRLAYRAIRPLAERAIANARRATRAR